MDKHDYEPDTESDARNHPVATDPPCRICGRARH